MGREGGVGAFNAAVRPTKCHGDTLETHGETAKVSPVCSIAEGRACALQSGEAVVQIYSLPLCLCVRNAHRQALPTRKPPHKTKRYGHTARLAQ